MLISLPESLRLPVWKYVCIFCVYEEDEEEDRKWCIMLGTINNSPTAAWRNWELHSPHTVTRNYTFLYFSLSSPFKASYCSHLLFDQFLQPLSHHSYPCPSTKLSKFPFELISSTLSSQFLPLSVKV